MKIIRQLHLWIGLFFAPTIIFFAFSGALQTFGLHETHKGSGRPSWIATMAEVHKDQRLAAPSRKSGPRPAARVADALTESPEPGTTSSVPLKWFLLFMSVGLILSSLLGIVMAFQYNRGRGLILALLALGAAIPIVLLKMAY